MIYLLQKPSILLKSLLITGLLSMAACASSPDTAQAPTPPESTEVPDESTADTTAEATDTNSTETASASDHSQPAKGGQVVEAGNYHLELVPVPEADGIHLDLYLQTGDDHSAIANATVTAQVQLPDGSTQELPLEYDAAGEHYFAFLPSQATGEYKVAILTDVNGEKANGRFTFTK